MTAANILMISLCLGQVIFNSAHYDFPPDILFHNLPELEDGVEDRSVLLPTEGFDLGHEDCLYDWFQRILTLIKKV